MKKRRVFFLDSLIGLLVVAAVLAALLSDFDRKEPATKRIHLSYQPRIPGDTSGFGVIESNIPPWDANASLQEIAQRWDRPGYRLLERIDGDLQRGVQFADDRMRRLLTKAIVLCSEGEARRAYCTLEEARTQVENNDSFARLYLFTIIYLQGVVALRIGENENCILCRGESSCILPIAPAAVHRNPYGSHLAIQHFSEYLRQFPDDLEIRWLLNLAHMTLGEYPHQVEPQFLAVQRYEGLAKDR